MTEDLTVYDDVIVVSPYEDVLGQAEQRVRAELSEQDNRRVRFLKVEDLLKEDPSGVVGRKRTRSKTGVKEGTEAGASPGAPPPGSAQGVEEDEGKQRSEERGRNSRRNKNDSLELAVEDALSRVDDPLALEATRLAHLKTVESYAAKHFLGRSTARGLAVQALLRKASQQAAAGLSGREERLGRFMTLYAEGRPIAEIARTIGVHREYASRAYRKETIRRVSAELHALLSTAKRS